MEHTEIIQLRKDLGLSQSDFAKFFGVSIPTMSRWEQGNQPPTKLAETTMYALRAKIDKAKSVGKQEEANKMIRNILLLGGLMAILVWIFSEDK